MREPTRRVLFVQATEAAGYPPIINAATVMAEAGWQVLILNAPIAGHDIAFPSDCGVELKHMPARPSHVMRKRDYIRYVLAAARLAASFRPNVVYASDLLGAAPGLLASKISGGSLVYHEHDSPNPGSSASKLMRLRARAARKARAVIFPNAARAKIAQQELGVRDEQLRIVWNVPRRMELPVQRTTTDPELIVYYHGSITPERLPESVLEAIGQCRHRVRLRIMGYEAPGATGYVAHLIETGNQLSEKIVEYLGQVPTRDGVFAEAARASIGLALMPRTTDDVNLTHMTGASNKAFDYMAAGLALLVTDLPDWQTVFVEPGYARSCNPSDSASIAAQLAWFAENSEERRRMGANGRTKIECDWNYETLFRPVLTSLNEIAA